MPIRLAYLLVAAGLSLSAPAARAQGMPNIVHPDGLPTSQESWRAQRLSNGLFRISARVNGTELPMVVDTGASVVTIRAEDAGRLGIDVAALSWSGIAMTANGRTTTAPVMLESVTIGGITRRDVRATVARPGQLSVNLLGQSFLSRVSVRMQGDALVFLNSP